MIVFRTAAISEIVIAKYFRDAIKNRLRRIIFGSEVFEKRKNHAGFPRWKLWRIISESYRRKQKYSEYNEKHSSHTYA